MPLVEFAINSTINRVTGMAPFEICGSLLPQMMQELPLVERIPPLGICTGNPCVLLSVPAPVPVPYPYLQPTGHKPQVMVGTGMGKGS